MGSGASKKRTGNVTIAVNVPEKVETSDPLGQGQGQGGPLTQGASGKGQDEIDGGPQKPNQPTVSLGEPGTKNEHKEVDNTNSAPSTNSVSYVAATESKNSSGSQADASEVTLIDFETARAARLEKFSSGVKANIANAKIGISHVRECDKFPRRQCVVKAREFKKISRNKEINRTDVSDGLAIDTDFCKVFAYTFRKRDILERVEGADPAGELPYDVQTIFNFYIGILGSAWNFTDKSEDFCIQMDNDECLTLLVDWFLYHHERALPMNEWVDDMSFDAINIFHNVCRKVPSISPKHHRLVPALQKFGESKETLTQTSAFITLSKLVKKEEADKLSTNNECIVLLLSLVEKCLASSDHLTRTNRKTSQKNMLNVVSFPAVELVQALEELAINDNNKKLIVKKGGVPILCRLLKPECSLQEKTFAANAIWRLAFLKEHKELLRKDQGIVYNLTENSQSDDENLRNACMGALFEIYESRLPDHLTSKKTDQGSPKRAQPEKEKSKGHIMLSYKWENPSKPVMREFKKQLRNRGYSVWMDEDHMMGDKIGAMAEAVENADMLISCITRGYQDSQDCRTEASYAYECKKKIIPVKVNDKFTPTGWLGGITAGKIYYIVQGADHVGQVLPTIIEKEFPVQKEVVQTVNAAPGPPVSEPESKPPEVDSQVPGWDSKKVQEWLAQNGIPKPNKALKNLNGKQLLQLKKQLSTAPQAFYQSMKDDLKVPYTDVLSLASALEDLK